MTKLQKTIRFVKILSLSFVFILCFLRLAVVAPSRPMNADEESGVAESYDYSYAELFSKGPKYELNTSPLHYLIDKAWIEASGSEPHRRLHLWLFFRIPPIFYFSLAALFFALMFYELGSDLVGPGTATTLIFSLASGFFLASGFQPSHSAALQDRPYSLWIFLSVLQLYFLTKRKEGSREDLEIGLALTHLLLVLTSFAAAIQVAAVVCLTISQKTSWNRKLLLKLTMESAPALAVALWFWSRSLPSAISNVNFTAFVDLWLDAISHYSWNPALPLTSVIHLGNGWRAQGISILLLAVSFLFVPLLLWKKKGWKNRARPIYMFLIFLILFSIPLLIVAWLWAKSLHSRYFIFLYPGLAAMQILSVLAIARALSFRWKRAPVAILLAWSALQLATRVPMMFFDIRDSMENRHTIFPSFSRITQETCPKEFGHFRISEKNSIDTLRLNKHCLLGIEPDAPDT